MAWLTSWGVACAYVATGVLWSAGFTCVPVDDVQTWWFHVATVSKLTSLGPCF